MEIRGQGVKKKRKQDLEEEGEDARKENREDGKKEGREMMIVKMGKREGGRGR